MGEKKVLSWRQHKKADLGQGKSSPSLICHAKALRQKYSNTLVNFTPILRF